MVAILVTQLARLIRSETQYLSILYVVILLVVIRFIPVSSSVLGLFLGQGVESAKRLKTYDPKIAYFR